MIRELVHVFRQLRRSPTSAVAAVLTLALTLGAGATILAVVDATLLTPPPFADPDKVVTLGELPVGSAGAPRMISYPTFEAWRDRARARAALAPYDPTNLTLTGLGAADRIEATDIGPEFLPLLGVAPALGRSFGPDDVGQAVAIVSDDFWRARLGADRDVIGRTLVLNGRAHTIVGVLPEQFRFPLSPTDVWRPLPLTAAQAARTTYRMRAIARLAAGVPPASLAAALDEVSIDSSPSSRAIITPITTAITRGAAGTLGLLAATVAIATLMAFFNLVGLLIVRSMDRTQELAVRVALGARPSGLIRTLVLEAEVLVVLGTGAGVLLATWLTPVVGRLVQQQFGSIANRDIAISWRVVAVVSVVAAICAAVSGLMPAWLAARRATAESLRRGSTRAPRELALRRFLIAGEVALAFVLLVSMALIGRSLAAVLERDPGFRAEHVLTLSVSLPSARYAGDPQEAAFYAALQQALEERLGIGTVAVVDELPLTGDGGRTLVGTTQTDAAAEAVARVAGPSYFRVMGIPVVAGRELDSRDGASSPQRVVISERLATRLFGRSPAAGGGPLNDLTSAIGRTVYLAGPKQAFEVVGVAGDVTHRALDEDPLETVYLSAWQQPSRSSHIVVRSDRHSEDVVAIVRSEVARLDRDLPVYAIRSMDAVVAASAGVPTRRVLMNTFTSFAVLALLLSAVGLFGIVAHDIASRRSELALRLALGAHPSGLLVATLRKGLTLIAGGVAVGFVLSVWSARALANLAPAIDGLDVASVVAAAAILLAVGTGAVFPAARRAARTDPLLALRSE